MISVRLEIPFTRETKIKGTAMSFRSFRKMLRHLDDAQKLELKELIEKELE